MNAPGLRSWPGAILSLGGKVWLPVCWAMVLAALAVSCTRQEDDRSRPDELAPTPAASSMSTSGPVASTSTAAWSRYSAVAGKGTRVSIEGTSSLHDWLVEGLIIGGTLEVGPQFPLDRASAKVGRLDARVEVFIPVRSLKSMKNGKAYSNAMDDIMYGKLLESQHKRILYRLTELTLKEVPADPNVPIVLEARGDLVAAGVTNSITMLVNLLQPRPNQLRLSGSVSVKMTDFRIEPPSPKIVDFITTGDEVTLRFDWLVQRK